MKRAFTLVPLIVLCACACEHFHPSESVTLDPETGAITLSRQGGILQNIKSDATIVHEWIDDENVLHQVRYQSGTDIKSDPLVEMNRMYMQELRSVYERLK